MRHEPVYIVLLNELTIPRLLFLALRRRPVFLIEAPAILPYLDGIIRRLANRLVERGRCKWLLDFDEQLARYKESRVPRHFNDAFRIIEPWMENAFHFNVIDRWLGEDGYPYRHVTCNHVLKYFDQIHLLHDVDESEPDGNITVFGATPMIQGLYRAVFGKSMTMHAVEPSHILSSVVKIIILLGVWGAIVRAGLQNLEWRSRPPRRFFLGADYIGYRLNGFDAALWCEFGETGGGVLQLFRSKSHIRNNREETKNYTSDCLGGGRLSPGTAFFVMISTWLKTYIYLYRLWSLDPVHFRTCLSMPYKRMLYWKLFQAYDFDFFWGNDDYNFEHIIRSQELRKRGGISIGAPHGLPVSAALAPMWRYVDYDRYYLIGMGLYKYYADTWPEHMTIKAIGSLGMTRERQARMSENRPDEIIFQTKVEWDFLGPPQRELLEGLATAFPDRKIYLQLKGSFKRRSISKDFVDWATTSFANVVATDENINDLFLKARYLVTDPSTISAEAIQFGLASFIMDFDDRVSLYFRDFEGLCYKTPGEILDRIKGIEAGTYHYPRENFTELVALSRPNLFDILREDMGLEPF